MVTAPALIKLNELDKAYRYAEDIKSGAIPACKWVKLAVDRFYRDLKEGPARGIVFNENEAALRLQAYDYINIKKTFLTKGRNGKEIQRNRYEPFILEPWQTFNLANKYGFYYEDSGLRRFTTSIICVPRKCGKTTEAAGDGIVGMQFDGELEAQVYCVATKKDQARILFKEAKKMVNISPQIRQFFDKENITKDSIYDPSTDSVFSPLSSDSNTLDGLNPHRVVIDECHEIKTSELYDVMISGMGNRLNPMVNIISTAGFHKDYWFYNFLMDCLGILEQKYEDDSIFVQYYTLDHESEIDNPDLWIKAVPNIGVSVQRSFIEREVNSMRNITSKRVGVLTKTFNIFTDSGDVWIENEIWKAQERDDSFLEGKTIKNVWGGIDFASSRDIYAISWLYQLEDGDFYLKHRFYTPGQMMGNRYTGNLAQMYASWERSGDLHTTPGRVIKSQFCEEYILETMKTEEVKFLGYDPYKATEIVDRMLQEIDTEWAYDEDKGKMVELKRMQPIRQGFVTMAEPTWKFEELINSGRLYHDGNKVMEWMVANAILLRDSSGNVKPDRKNENKKIDGVYSTLDAIAVMLQFDDIDEEQNVDDFIISGKR